MNHYIDAAAIRTAPGEPFGPFTLLIVLAIVTILTWIATIATDKLRYGNNNRSEFHPDVRVRQKRITGIIYSTIFVIISSAWLIADSQNPYAKKDGPADMTDMRSQKLRPVNDWPGSYRH